MLEYDEPDLPGWRLMHESGWSFPLDFEFALLSIGRADHRTGWKPRIDLGEIDAIRTVSRRHAVLVVTKYSCNLREEPGARNGTFVNGRQLTSAQSVRLHTGDVIRFGEVRLHLSRQACPDDDGGFA